MELRKEPTPGRAREAEREDVPVAGCCQVCGSGGKLEAGTEHVQEDVLRHRHLRRHSDASSHRLPVHYQLGRDDQRVVCGGLDWVICYGCSGYQSHERNRSGGHRA